LERFKETGAMINTQELRLGNWVTEKGISSRGRSLEGPFQVEIHDLSYHFFLEPIPLSEEWLIKFGITKYEEDITTEHFFGGVLFHLGNDEWLILHNGEFHFIRDRSSSAYDGSTEYRTTVIKYVHHLQNIYFAHKFEELTIKE
jgi:hypothetical protein